MARSWDFIYTTKKGREAGRGMYKVIYLSENKTSGCYYKEMVGKTALCCPQQGLTYEHFARYRPFEFYLKSPQFHYVIRFLEKRLLGDQEEVEGDAALRRGRGPRLSVRRGSGIGDQPRWKRYWIFGIVSTRCSLTELFSLKKRNKVITVLF